VGLSKRKEQKGKPTGGGRNVRFTSDPSGDNAQCDGSSLREKKAKGFGGENMNKERGGLEFPDFNRNSAKGLWSQEEKQKSKPGGGGGMKNPRRKEEKALGKARKKTPDGGYRCTERKRPNLK